MIFTREQLSRIKNVRFEEIGPDTFEVYLYVNQSRLQYFMDCKRKYWWLFELEMEPDQPRWALEDGKAVHVGLAEQATGKSVDEAVSLALTSLAASMPSRKMQYDEANLHEHQALVERMLRAYFQNYGTKPLWHPLGIEVRGTVEVGSGQVLGNIVLHTMLVFRTDRIVNWANRLWIIDHKTAARLDMRDMLKYEMDLQFSAYVYGASKILGQRVAGVIADILVKTNVPQFHQQPYVRSDAELEDFARDFCEMGRELLERRTRALSEDPKTVFYKNTKECFRYGTCPYRDLCLQDTPTRRLLFIHREEDYVDTAGASPVGQTHPHA